MIKKTIINTIKMICKKVSLLFTLLLLLSTTGCMAKSITVFTIGDSTMAPKDTVDNPERGWAMAFPLFFNKETVRFENHARNGRSTKSFIDEGRWDTVVNSLSAGDYVFIQFGHNDEKEERASLYAAPNGAYRDNLSRFVKETQDKGAFPVLMTPIIRRKFNAEGLLENTHGEYPDAVRRLAAELKVPFIDMEAKSRKAIEKLGPEASKDLFVWFGPGVHKRFSKGKQDDTHLKFTGAVTMAQLAVDGIRELKLPIEKELVPYDLQAVGAPFPMPLLSIFRFPEKDFPITNFGAVADEQTNNTQAIAQAIEACSKAGGGRVVVPAGTWITGSIHFKSNVNLHLEENAVLSFTDNPADYLPAVQTSWEGLECYNYSPLVYAFECENIAITGAGMLKPKMNLWRVWFKRPAPHLEALKKLYTMASTDVPVVERQMAEGENNLRPHLIHFNRCKNILLDSFQIQNSPFWTVHIYMCENGVARNLKVRAHGHNNDGIDLEMTRNFLVEDCLFDQGDDAVVIKSGRNRDAWRLNTPAENIVVRNCHILKGHTLLGIGSEMSGGVRNVYMHDCDAPNDVHRLFFLKTNHRRGGFIENIYMDRIQAGSMLRVFEIDTEVLYQWKDLVPTYEERITRIEGIHISNVKCKETKAVYEIKGDAREPIRNVTIQNIQVDKILEFTGKVKNAENVITDL